MKLALALAKRGTGKVSPNPMVGCIIVKNGKIVGKGYHEFFGGPHAEINALKKAGRQAVGSTLYVTLEPCNHFGKTPPCTDAIQRAGVARVVAAVRDPNPRTNGKGLESLTRRSIEVSEGVLARDARKLNAFYFENGPSKVGRVIVKYAMTADGKIATRTGDSKWISSKESRNFVHRLRTTVDADIVGANTVMRDNPWLTSHGQGPNPVRVVIDPRLRVPLDRRILDGTAPTIVFHNFTRMKNKLAALHTKHIITVRLAQRYGAMNFRDIIARLNDFSLQRIMIEGGGTTIASALEDEVVTDLFIFVAPTIIGGQSALSPVEGSGISRMIDARHLMNTRMTKIGTDFLLTAKVSRAKVR